jgi:cobalt-zinc-cadmium efflux system outer membrane protein
MPRMIPRRPSLGLLTLLLSATAHAEPAPATLPPTTDPAPPAAAPPTLDTLSLNQASDRFRRENLRLVAARYDVSAARAEVIAAGVLPNPNLSLGAELFLHGQPESADQQYSAMLSQALPLSGHIGARKDAAELGATAAEREFAATSWQLFGELRRAYLGLQLVQERYAVLHAGLSDLDRIERVLAERAAAGANPAYDRVRLQVERGSLRARLSEAEFAAATASAELAGAIGGSPLDSQLVAGDALGEPSLESRETSALVRLALAQRHEVAASRLQATAAEARLRATRLRYLPDPEIGVGYARWRSIPGAASNAGGGALLLSASIPLPIFDHGQGSIQQKLEQSRAARVQERDVQNLIAREVALAASTLRAARVAYQEYRTGAQKDAEAVRRIAEISYREGRGSILELLDAYSSYLRVQEQALDLRARALGAGIDLQQALGVPR